jgi:hypothetical protein
MLIQGAYDGRGFFRGRPPRRFGAASEVDAEAAFAAVVRGSELLAFWIT